nr:hypothetical protein [Tanacetum cinerariifolium]
MGGVKVNGGKTVLRKIYSVNKGAGEKVLWVDTLAPQGRNNNHKKNTTTDTGTCTYSALGSDGILNDVTPRVDAAMKVVSPSVVEETVAMECPMVNILGVGLNPPPPMHEANDPAGNAPGKPSYATATGKPSRKKVNVHTLYTPGGNGIDVVAYPVVANYVKNTWGASEKKTMKKPSQTSRCVPVSPKIDFKPQKEYRPVTKNPNASSSGNKKKGVEPTIEVSNSNPFDVLNSVDNDDEFGKLRLLDNDGNPLIPTGLVESDSEVEMVFNEPANLRISTSDKDGSDIGYGTNSLLEQWRDSYPDNDDYDLYDDDMYENHNLS